MTTDIFACPKPIIGMIHLKPLPGSPGWSGCLDDVIGSALEDAQAIENGGMDGALIENFGDVPYVATHVGPETVAMMAVIGSEIKRNTHLPIGVNVLRNDAGAAMAIATASKASFIRVNVHVGSAWTDQGLIEGEAYHTLRFKKMLGSGVAIMADIFVKHGTPADRRSPAEVAMDTVRRGLADYLILTGSATGIPPDLSLLKEVKQSLPDFPVFLGSGLNLSNIEEMMANFDGAIVGTAIKFGHDVSNPVDVEKVRKLFQLIKPSKNGKL